MSFTEDAMARMAALDTGFALSAGLRDPASALPPGHASFVLERLELLQTLERESLEAKEPAHDLAHFRQCVALERFAQIELGERRSNPDVLTPLGDMFMAVLFAPYDSEAQRFDRLHAMVAEVPMYLAGAASTFSPPDPLWLAIAGEVAEGFPALLDVLPEASRHRASAATSDQLVRACAEARGALRDFTRRLRELPAGPSVRVLGPDRFQELLRLKGLPLDFREILDFGKERFAKLREERHALAKKLTLFGDERAARQTISAHHPQSFDDGLRYIRTLAREARDFAYEHELVPIANDDALEVIETPAFARPLIPFAAILPAKPLWPLQRSTYYVTRSDSLSDMHYADLHNVVPHEAYPGHHLQFTIANQRGSLLRNVPWTFANAAAVGVDTIEGWAHYSEALMKEHGFHVELADQFQFTSDAFWRAARVLIDIGLATGRMSLDDAMTLLHEDVGLPVEAARSEVRRYTLMPGYNLCYTFGKYLIGELRRDAERAWGRGFSLSRFHELVMTNGIAPLSVCRERLQAPAL
jgi:uncharacterized protein (DUF885 family)